MQWEIAGWTDRSYQRWLRLAAGIVTRMRRLWVAPALALIILSGCSPAPAPPAADASRTEPPSPAIAPELGSLTPQDQHIVDASRSSLAAPEQFRRRSHLPSCGQIRQGPTDPKPRKFPCLQPSNQRLGAELVLLRRTVEGDPIIQYVRVCPDIEGVEIFSDNTQDRFGVKEWTHIKVPFSRLEALGF